MLARWGFESDIAMLMHSGHGLIGAFVVLNSEQQIVSSCCMRAHYDVRPATVVRLYGVISGLRVTHVKCKQQ